MFTFFVFLQHMHTHMQKHRRTIKGRLLQAGCLNQTLELVRGCVVQQPGESPLPASSPPSLILSLQLISWCWLSGARTLIALIFMTIISTEYGSLNIHAISSWITVCSMCESVFDLNSRLRQSCFYVCGALVCLHLLFYDVFRQVLRSVLCVSRLNSWLFVWRCFLFYLLFLYLLTQKEQNNLVLVIKKQEQQLVPQLKNKCTHESLIAGYSSVLADKSEWLDLCI